MGGGGEEGRKGGGGGKKEKGGGGGEKRRGGEEKGRGRGGGKINIYLTAEIKSGSGLGMRPLYQHILHVVSVISEGSVSMKDLEETVCLHVYQQVPSNHYYQCIEIVNSLKH